MARFGKSLAFVGGGIGDVVMHAGHLEGIAAQSDGGVVVVGCRYAGPVGEIFAGSTFVSEVISLEDEASKFRFRTVRERLSPHGFKSIFMLKSQAQVSLAARLSGIRRYQHRGRYDPRSLLEGPYAPPIHMSKTDALFRRLHIPFDSAACRLRPTGEAAAFAGQHMGERPFVAIGLNSSAPVRQWGDHFIGLVRRLAERFPVNFLLYGGPDVRELSQRVVLGAGLPASRLIDIPAEGYRIGVSHALLARCLLYVGNDSSGLNLAALCGMPTVGLFSETPPFTWSPVFIPVEPDPPGSGIAGIRPEAVWRASEQALHALLA